jgi:hypothetical protein
MGVVHVGQPGAYVQELPDALLGGQVTHGAGEEVPGGAGAGLDAGEDLAEGVTGHPVDFVVVLSAQPVVPDPGRLRHGGVDLGERLLLGVRCLISHGRSCAYVVTTTKPSNISRGCLRYSSRLASCAPAPPTCL